MGQVLCLLPEEQSLQQVVPHQERQGLDLFQGALPRKVCPVSAPGEQPCLFYEAEVEREGGESLRGTKSRPEGGWI